MIMNNCPVCDKKILQHARKIICCICNKIFHMKCLTLCDKDLYLLECTRPKRYCEIILNILHQILATVCTWNTSLDKICGVNPKADRNNMFVASSIFHDEIPMIMRRDDSIYDGSRTNVDKIISIRGLCWSLPMRLVDVIGILTKKCKTSKILLFIKRHAHQWEHDAWTFCEIVQNTLWLFGAIFSRGRWWTKWQPFRRRYFQMHFSNDKFCILMKISPGFVLKGQTDNCPALV